MTMITVQNISNKPCVFTFDANKSLLKKYDIKSENAGENWGRVVLQPNEAIEVIDGDITKKELKTHKYQLKTAKLVQSVENKSLQEENKKLAEENTKLQARIKELEKDKEEPKKA